MYDFLNELGFDINTNHINLREYSVEKTTASKDSLYIKLDQCVGIKFKVSIIRSLEKNLIRTADQLARQIQ